MFTIEFFQTAFEIFDKFKGLFLNGVLITLQLALVGTLIGLVIGLVVGAIKAIQIEERDSFLVKVMKRFISFILACYIEFFRGTPMMVQAIFIYYGLRPVLGWDPMTASITIISINTGAYMAEIIRSGIQSVDRGQIEGARSIGLSNLQTMFYIVLPQAIKNAFPSVINEFIVNIKDSSVLNVIAVNDLYFQGSSAAGTIYKYSETFFVIALIYFCLTFTTSKILQVVERKMNMEITPISSSTVATKKS